MRSVHERHHLALVELGAGGHLPAVVAAAHDLGIRVEHAPRSMAGRLRAGPGPYAEMVLALGPRPQDVVSVECWVSRPDDTPASVRRRAGAVGWLVVTPITADPVAATAATLEAREAALVRYHRGRRATVRLVAPRRPGVGPVAYAKVFTDHRGLARHELAARLTALAEAGEVRLRVPRPAGYDPERFVLWHHEVTGLAATDLLRGATGPRTAAQLGAGLASLHSADLVLPKRMTGAGLLLRTERYAADVRRLVPALGQRVTRLLARVGDEPSASTGPSMPVHGSPDPSQWLVDPEQVLPGLLDFDRAALGEPETDLACFLVEVEALGRGVTADVAEGFLAGYRAAGGHVDPEALARHCTMRRVGKVVRAARALRVDGDRRAERVLAAAERADGLEAGTVATAGGGRASH